MAAVGCCRSFCRAGWQPTIQLIRGAKSITRHWRPMNIMRQKLMAITEYIPPKPLIPEECMPRVKAVEEEHGFTKLLRRQVEETFRENNMIMVCQYNSAPSYNITLMTSTSSVMKHNIHAYIPKQIIIPFLAGSKYKNLLPLFLGRNLLLVSPETRARERRCLESRKSIPESSISIGGCVDNTIMSKEGFTNYANLPSMAASQGEVVGALSLLSSQTSTLLQRGPIHLTSLLDQYVKQQTGNGAEVKEGGDS
ncbi:39S ribosomal protein L10, mitochondrial [Sphaerodactylus townsendi]|uniref:39S ribosomal protein L10, mitochondrial n=1 Tax=Sphaerodactylus townsendi TaxID=933632 RepID=UPI0020276293|nr:39S ribosomal protein L10, mitochondrial [Sphaerodactylus townsendi]